MLLENIVLPIQEGTTPVGKVVDGVTNSSGEIMATVKGQADTPMAQTLTVKSTTTFADSNCIDYMTRNRYVVWRDTDINETFSDQLKVGDWITLKITSNTKKVYIGLQQVQKIEKNAEGKINHIDLVPRSYYIENALPAGSTMGDKTIATTDKVIPFVAPQLITSKQDLLTLPVGSYFFEEDLPLNLPIQAFYGRVDVIQRANYGDLIRFVTFYSKETFIGMGKDTITWKQLATLSDDGTLDAKKLTQNGLSVPSMHYLTMKALGLSGTHTVKEFNQALYNKGVKHGDIVRFAWDNSGSGIITDGEDKMVVNGGCMYIGNISDLSQGSWRTSTAIYTNNDAKSCAIRASIGNNAEDLSQDIKVFSTATYSYSNGTLTITDK